MDVTDLTSALSHYAKTQPNKVALIMGASGEVRTFKDLDARSNQGAHGFRSLGLAPGSTVAVCIENSPEFLEVVWAALRSGLVLVPISSKLTAHEIAFIVSDSGASVLVSSPGIGPAYGAIAATVTGARLLSVAGASEGFESWPALIENQPEHAIEGAVAGREMLYSSGTTGRPKGIRYLNKPGAPQPGINSVLALFERLGVNDQTTYLSPAPLYHAAPLAWTLGVQRAGGTAVVMEKFDAELALALIEKHRVSVSQWVPTHFVRILKLPEETRTRYDLSSLKLALHAAAPCPKPIKHAMIEWWGPILLEYFGSSEQAAITLISSQEWLAHPGSVGRCLVGKIYICDDVGEPLPVGEVGYIHSAEGVAFAYHNDPKKTALAVNERGWTCVGDVGYLDEEGYLYLTDRRDFMIIRGGVNIYPQEIEDLLVTHPAIADAAVIGTPHEDLGQEVTAIIQPMDMHRAHDGFADELRAWLRERLSAVKTPRRIAFVEDLPRLPTGKMAKFKLRDQYADWRWD